MAEIKNYNPSLRDRIGAYLTGDRKSTSEWGRNVNALIGSNGISDRGTGLIDYTPAGVPLNAFDAGRALGRGQFTNALLSGAMIAPEGAVAARGLIGAARGARMGGAIGDAAMNTGRRDFLKTGAAAAAVAPFAVKALGKSIVEGAAPKAVEAATPAVEQALTPHLAAAQSHMEAAAAHEDIVKRLQLGQDITDPSFKDISRNAFQKSMEANEDTSVPFREEFNNSQQFGDNDGDFDEKTGEWNQKRYWEALNDHISEHPLGDAASEAEGQAAHAFEGIDTLPPGRSYKMDPDDMDHLIETHIDAATAHRTAAELHQSSDAANQFIKLRGPAPHPSTPEFKAYQSDLADFDMSHSPIVPLAR